MANQTVSGDGSQPGTEPEIEVIEEAPGSQPEPQGGDGQAASQSQAAAAPDDIDDEVEEDAGDARTGHRQGQAEAQGGAIQETQEQLTARQRRRRAERAARERERAELARLRMENQQLRQSQGRLDQRLANVEVSSIDSQIAALESEVQRATQVMKGAMAAQNGEDFVTAQEIRDTLRDRLHELKLQKAQAMQQRHDRPAGQPVGASPVAGVTPQQARMASIFMQRHSWVDLSGADPDSARVLQLDTQLTREGSNPSTPEHWLELERRVREELPHRFQSVADNGEGSGSHNGNGRQQINRAARSSGGPKIPGNGSGAGGGNGEGPIKFHLSAERKQALIDMGVWDDPKERMRYIKRFVDWDKAAAANKQ